MKFFRRQERLQKLTVAEASLASLQSSVAALRARRAELDYEILSRRDELEEIDMQLAALEPALREIVNPFEIELDMRELTHEVSDDEE